MPRRPAGARYPARGRATSRSPWCSSSGLRTGGPAEGRPSVADRASSALPGGPVRHRPPGVCQAQLCAAWSTVSEKVLPSASVAVTVTEPASTAAARVANAW
ncbi:hypothetical protein BJF88_05920 [Cellulosimicrobium sp. CUA-896]|nr:hypothetical protein BJF88_05920 [Cellulosimicrobium sp. CUA-896]